MSAGDAVGRPTFSPYELVILLHYYTTPGDYPHNDAPVWPETVQRLRGLGLLSGNLDVGSDHRLTPRGKAFVELSLCGAPLPVQRWVIETTSEPAGDPR